jgi:hypothetical protein
MEPNPIPPPKKKSKHLGLILVGLAVVGFIALAVSSGSGSSSSAGSANVVSPTSQTASAYQQVQVQNTSDLSNNNTYVNSDGNTVHSPAYSNSVPTGATAQCGDGTYSFSQHRQGTCSHHGGVANWLN